jgi:GDP-L-fucose synthase
MEYVSIERSPSGGRLGLTRLVPNGKGGRVNLDAKIYVAGHQGLVGSAIVRALTREGYKNIVQRRHGELDLTRQSDVEDFFDTERPQYVFVAAAKVGGIMANSSYPADFILQNLQIETNIIQSAHKTGVDRLLLLGSSCIYPKFAAQPIREEYLLSGLLEPTNRPYAVAKIAGIEMCWAHNRQHATRYLSTMPTNIYGPRDNYDLETSHVIPAIIRKMHEAKLESKTEVTLWGNGTPRREFLYSDDLADACLFLMNLNAESFDSLVTNLTTAPIINIGSGHDLTIRELAETVAQVVGFDGRVNFDANMPNGTPRKLLDVSKLNSLGWTPATSLRAGLATSYQAFLCNYNQGGYINGKQVNGSLQCLP